MRTLIVVLMLAFAASVCNAQWVLTNGPRGVYVYSFAVSGSNVFAASDTSALVATGGSVFLSTNNGTDWANVSTGLSCPAIRALAINDTNIFAGSLGGGVFLSTNRGTSWTNVSNGLLDTDVYTLLVSPNEAGGANLFAGTLGGGVFLSTNNGTNWTNVSAGLSNSYIYDLAFSQNGAERTNLFAGTGGNGVFLSTNNGTSWTQTPLNSFYIRSLAVGGSNIFASAEGGGVFLSTDNGASWMNIGHGLPLPIDLVTRGTNVFALTNWGRVFLSTDNGANWTLVNEGIIDTLILCLGINDTYIFAGSSGGGVWRRPLLEMLTAVKSLSDLATRFILDQNYPNPFNPTTTIQYSLLQASFVKLTVYNTLGQQVAQLVNEQQPAGYHDAVFRGDGLASGVYFYRMIAGEYTLQRKMLLLR